MRDDKNNLIVDLTFEFSLQIIEYAELLYERKKFNISNQLLKQELRLVQMCVKHRMRKVKQTSFIK